MHRGEIWSVDLDPIVGAEAGRHRPAIIVSNDHANTAAARLGAGTITVLPITSNLARVLPFHVALPRASTGLRLDSKAQAEQVRTISVARIDRRLGAAGDEQLSELDDALRLHLDL